MFKYDLFTRDSRERQKLENSTWDNRMILTDISLSFHPGILLYILSSIFEIFAASI